MGKCEMALLNIRALGAEIVNIATIVNDLKLSLYRYKEPISVHKRKHFIIIEDIT